MRGLPPVRGALFALLGQFLARLMGFAFFAVVARRLGIEALGAFGVAASAGYLCVALIDPGLNVLLVRDGAPCLATLRKRFGEMLQFKIVAAVLAWGFVVALAWGGTLGDNWPFVAMVAGAALLGFVEDAASSALAARQRLDLDGLLRVLFRGLPVGFGLIALAASTEPLMAAGGYAAGTLTAVPVAWLLVSKAGASPTWHGFRLSPVLALLRSEWPIALGAACWVATLKVGPTLADLCGLSPFHIGVHGAAFRMVDALTAVPGVMAAAFYAPIARRPMDAGIVEDSVLANLSLTLPLAAGGAVVAKDLLSLVFGPGFELSAPLLAALGLSLPLAGLLLVLGFVAIARGQRSLWGMIAALDLVVQVLTSVVLVRWISVWGIVVGALLGHCVGVVGLLWGLGLRPLSGSWSVRLVLACAGMTALVALAGDRAPVLLVVGLGGATYAVAIWATGVGGRLRSMFVRESGP